MGQRSKSSVKVKKQSTSSSGDVTVERLIRVNHEEDDHMIYHIILIIS